MPTKIHWLLLSAILIPALAVAQERPEVSIVFNVDQRAFTCWFEGDPVPAPAPTETAPGLTGCPFANAHVFRDDVHFFRGQRVSLRLVGARIVDSFSVDLKADDLVIPGIPVFGSDVELPSLKAIEPITRLVLASGVSNVAAPPDVVGTRLRPRIDKSSAADYQKLLEEIIENGNHADLFLLLGGAVNRVTGRLDTLLAPTGTLQTTADGINAAVATHLNTFTVLKNTFCAGTVPSVTAAEFSGYLQALLAYRQIIERQKAFQAQIDAAALPAAATALAALQKAVNAEGVQRALNYNTTTVTTFLTQLRALFTGLDPAAVIGGLKIASPPKYVKADDTEPPFLQAINTNQAVAPTPASLALLKENLATLNSFEPALTAALANLVAARQARTDLNTYLERTATTPSRNIPSFNDFLNDIAVASVAVADAANCVARTMPLPVDLTVPLSDAWYASKQVTVTLKRSNRFSLLTPSASRSPLADPFDPGAKPAPASTAAAASTEKATGDAAAQKAAAGEKPATGAKPAAPAESSAAPRAADPAPAPSAGEVMGTARFRIRNLYHFQLAMGFMRSWTPDRRYTLVKETVKVDNVDVTNQFFVLSRDREYRFLPSVDILFYPYERDFFPNTRRHAGDTRPFYKKIGGLAGFSLTDPTQDFFLGGVYMADSGIGLKVGLHLGYSDKLPSGVEVEVPIVAKSTIAEQELKKGFFIGIELNAGLFRDVVGVILKK